MRNDPPTSLRRGYGYRQARAAGLGGVRADRSPRQVNNYIKARKADDNGKEYLRDEIHKDPEWGPFVEHWIREGLSVNDVVNALYNAKYYAWCRLMRFKSHRAPF